MRGASPFHFVWSELAPVVGTRPEGASETAEQPETRSARLRSIRAEAASYNDRSSPLLANGDVVRIVVKLADEQLALALTCSVLRDAVRANGRLRTRPDKCVSSVQRLSWAAGLGCPLDARLCIAAALEGRLLVLQHARDVLDCPWDLPGEPHMCWGGSGSGSSPRHPPGTCSAAAVGGHLAVLRWAHEHGAPWDQNTCEASAGRGHLHCLQWAHDNGCPWSRDTTAWASRGARGASLKCLRYALEQGCEYDGEEMVSSAAGAGHIEHLAFLHDIWEVPYTTQTCLTAAMNGQLEVLKWLRQREPPCPWGAGCCALSTLVQHKGDNEDNIADGAIEQLQWLRSQDPPAPWDETTCINAARWAWAALVWARSQSPPCPWDERTSTIAALHSLKKLQWVRAQDPPCPWDEDCCEVAAFRGDLETLRWAVEHGCPWDRMECLMIASSPFDWAEDASPWYLEDEDMYDDGDESGHVAVRQWIVAQLDAGS